MQNQQNRLLALTGWMLHDKRFYVEKDIFDCENNVIAILGKLLCNKTENRIYYSVAEQLWKAHEFSRNGTDMPCGRPSFSVLRIWMQFSVIHYQR